MKRDKRRGLLAGYKKAGPTLKFMLIAAALSLILGGIYFLVELRTGSKIDKIEDKLNNSMDVTKSGVRERPYVFFKMTRLLKPLAIGDETTVEYKLANSGQMEAIGFIRDITYYFDFDPAEHSFEYQKSIPVNFSLAPTAELYGQLRFSFVLTEEKLTAIVDGRARLYFFARGEYKDSLDRVYPLPFCRMYDNDMPGNLIICSDQMKFGQEEGGDRNN